MTLDHDTVWVGLGLMGICALAGTAALIMAFVSRSGRSGKAFRSGRRVHSPHLSMRGNPLANSYETPLQKVNGMYSHALQLLDRGFSVKQVRQQVNLTHGELELLIRMRRVKSSFTIRSPELGSSLRMQSSPVMPGSIRHRGIIS